MSENTPKFTTRREFIKQTGAIAAGTAVFAAGMVPNVHSSVDDTIKLALVGCGGRGSGAASNALSVQTGPTRLVAMADVFEDRVKRSYQGLTETHATGIDVPEDRKFIGMDAYKDAMDCLDPGDIVILATPPAFRWVHLTYAIERGLNVFMEKPLTVDGPTTRRMRDKDVDCVFVSGPEGLGIATRTDLLEAIALGHQALDDPVGRIASRPVIGCDVSDPLFHALVIMTRSGIERMAVFDEGALQGTLGLAELLSHYSAHSHVIGLRAARAVSREELVGAAAQVNQLVRTLYATGGRMQYLAELVSAVNQRLMSRLFEFCFEEPVR